MVAAGLLAKHAVERGLSVKPWVKTSLAPGSKVVMDYYERAGLTPYLDKLGFGLVGFGCTTCIGNSGPLLAGVPEAVAEGGLAVVSVLSGNRNFEGRINPDVRMQLPGVAAAGGGLRPGRFDGLRHRQRAPGDGHATANRSTCGHLAHAAGGGARRSPTSLTADMFRESYADGLRGRRALAGLDVPPRATPYEWGAGSTYVRAAALFRRTCPMTPAADRPTHGRPGPGQAGRLVTTDHISPAGNIRTHGPAGT